MVQDIPGRPAGVRTCLQTGLPPALPIYKQSSLPSGWSGPASRPGAEASQQHICTADSASCWQDASKEDGSRDRSSSSQIGRRHRTQSEVVSASPPDYFFSPAALGRSPPGRQYTSANHLLNFKYAPRPQVRAEQCLPWGQLSMSTWCSVWCISAVPPHQACDKDEETQLVPHPSCTCAGRGPAWSRRQSGPWLCTQVPLQSGALPAGQLPLCGVGHGRPGQAPGQP